MKGTRSDWPRRRGGRKPELDVGRLWFGRRPRSVTQKKVICVAKYLIQASYTTEGIRGVLKEGGSSRATTIEKMITELGGRMESFYFAFGSDDVYVIADLPDNTTAASIGLTVTASGAVRTKTVVLLTPEEIDRATHQTIEYRAPGTP